MTLPFIARGGMLLLLCLLTVACGQKGPLILPEEAGPAQSADAAGTTTTPDHSDTHHE